MSQTTWFVLVAGTLVVLGLGRLAGARDWITRLLALNVTGAGSLVLLVALAGRTHPADPVPHALALTGIVITVAVTGVGLILARLGSIAAESPDNTEERHEASGGSPAEERP